MNTIQKYYNPYGKEGQLTYLVNEKKLEPPKDDKVYTLEKIIEEMDFRNLLKTRENRGRKAGFPQEYHIYSCKDCCDCSYKQKCLYKYDENKDQNKNKVMKINHKWEDLKNKAESLIKSEKGILNRNIRSIQTEGSFGDMKKSDSFRKFNHRSKDKVFKETLLYNFSRNINKYHKFINDNIKSYEIKSVKVA